AFIHRLVKTLLSLSAKGSCVVVGRGAPLVMPPERTLRVRVVASKQDRVRKIREHLGLSSEAAAEWVEKTDRERIGFAKDHFHKDPTDAHLYDLVLNTSRFSFEECADFIVGALERLRCRTAV